MRVINFLYYIVYRVFKLIPRREPIDHELASSFCAGLFWTNILTIFIGCFRALGFTIESLNSTFVKVFLISIFILIYFLNKWYFLKRNNYKEIITKYDIEYKPYFIFISILGVIYSIGSFLAFYFLIIYFNSTCA